MRFGSVCSGIEAASVAWHPLGWQPVFFSEIEPFPCAVLEAADRPLLMFELMDATFLSRANVWSALNRYADLIERTGRPMHYRYALRKPA